MQKCVLILVLFVLSCSEKEGTEVEGISENQNPEKEELSVTVEKPDRSEMIDESISSNVELEFGENELAQKTVFALVDGGKYLVEKYEGTFMKASGVNGMFLLKFIPFSSWDDNLDMEVKSPFDFDLEIFLRKDQNDELGYVDYSKATNNIAWDYFENLFTIYYYENDEGEAFPLKFVNLGKTEWDG
jgi:hypothetical protein